MLGTPAAVATAAAGNGPTIEAPQPGETTAPPTPDAKTLHPSQAVASTLRPRNAAGCVEQPLVDRVAKSAAERGERVLVGLVHELRVERSLIVGLSLFVDRAAISFDAEHPCAPLVLAAAGAAAHQAAQVEVRRNVCTLPKGKGCLRKGRRGCDSGACGAKGTHRARTDENGARLRGVLAGAGGIADVYADIAAGPREGWSGTRHRPRSAYPQRSQERQARPAPRFQVRTFSFEPPVQELSGPFLTGCNGFGCDICATLDSI